MHDATGRHTLDQNREHHKAMGKGEDVGTHKIRDTKDGMSRWIVKAVKTPSISIASATYDITGSHRSRLDADGASA